jgi:hypothetical protein
VPADAAVFVHIDAAAIWNHPIVKSIRMADERFIDELSVKGRELFGLTPDDLKTVTLFAPNMKKQPDHERVGLVLTFKKAFDKNKIEEGAKKLLPEASRSAVKIVAVNDRTALLLLNLGHEYASTQQAGATGPLTATLQEAGSGKHALVGGVTVENLPEELQRDDLPAPFRPFQPLFKATTFSARIDLGKSIDLEVRVKTATAGQAVDCEKSLGVLLGLIQDALKGTLKQFDTSSEPAIKDLVALLNAGVATTKNAKFKTLGTEARVSVSLPVDLPFAGAYLAAKQKAMEAAAAASSANNLKQIALAMHNYSDVNNGTMPPAAVCDKTGKPLLSWRVLILPYVEEEKLFKEFKLDEPWDSDHNKKLIARMPKVYAIPGKTKPGGTSTHYRVFVGNGAGFDWIRGSRFPADFSDGTSNTIMCITAETAVPWTKPDELEFDPEKDTTRQVGMIVNGGVQFAMFDGSVRTLAKIPPKATLNALITRSGGEVIPNDFDK